MGLRELSSDNLNSLHDELCQSSALTACNTRSRNLVPTLLLTGCLAAIGSISVHAQSIRSESFGGLGGSTNGTGGSGGGPDQPGQPGQFGSAQDPTFIATVRLFGNNGPLPEASGGGGGGPSGSGVSQAGGAGGPSSSGGPPYAGAGGAGGVAGFGSNSGSFGSSANYTGTNGATGQDAFQTDDGAVASSGSGGGGAGGYGAILPGSGAFGTTARITGGRGGDGGGRGYGYGLAPLGSGGDGGVGLRIRGQANFSNNAGAQITGGDGGNGGGLTPAQALTASGSTTNNADDVPLANGGNGGNGGAGLSSNSSQQFINDGLVRGGAGGSGGAGVYITTPTFNPTALINGNGGAGGAGMIFLSAASLTNSGIVAAGTGGAGGVGVRYGTNATSNFDTAPYTAFSPGGTGGNGGAGGLGTAFAAGGVAQNSGSIAGGNGGAGGAGASTTNPGGSGGSGGNGIFAPNGLILTNSGTVVGGNGGIGGSAGTAFAGSSGGGGAGILGSGLTIDNAGGTITGGLSGDGLTRADAVTLTGGTNFIGTGGTLNGGITVQAGSFAPALASSTIGTPLVVNGSLTFTNAAVYNIRVTPTANDSVSLTGVATLGGATVNASFAAGTYVEKQYTIITALGGVAGTFNTLSNTNLPSGFKSGLSYNANNAFLNLTLDLTPEGPTAPPGPTAPNTGLNINQTNVANALTNFFNTTGSIPMVFGALTPFGLTIASGELPTAAQQNAFDSMELFLGVLTDPFNARHGGSDTTVADASRFATETDAALAFASNGASHSTREQSANAALYKAPAMADAMQRWSFWAGGFGGTRTTDGNAVVGSNNATSSLAAGVVGADYRFSPDTFAGFAVAGGGTQFTVANSFGTGRSDLFQGGAFVRHTAGPAYITAALAYSWQDITTERTVALAGTGMLRAHFDANTYSGRAEGGYRLAMPWLNTGITPYAAGQVVTFALPAYGEQTVGGANTFALNYAAKDVTAPRSELGLRSDTSFPMQDGIFTLRGRAAWAHSFNPDRSLEATFQILPGASFIVNGAAQAYDSALVTGSAEMKWRNGWSAVGTFEGEFSSVSNGYAGKGRLRYAW